MNKQIILALILILAFLLRFINIWENPPALYGDELTIALDANSLLKTGKDQLGNLLPLTFEMGAGRPAGYVYFSIPFVALFGPTELGVRILSVLSGVGIVFLLYLISKKLFEERVGIVAAVLTAITPWTVNLSRGGFEANFALFLSLLGIYFLLLAKTKTSYYILAALSFGVVIHTYPTFKLSLPLVLPIILWFLKPFQNINSSKDKFFFVVSFLIIILFGTLAITQTFFTTSEKRFSEINIFSKEELRNTIEQKVNLERNLSDLSQNFAILFHNKPIEYSKIFIENYLQNFSLNFLVIHGDGNPRHNTTTMGQIFFAQFILFFVGLISFWAKEKRILGILLLWLILAPIPTALVDLPHALRSSFMLPPIIIISSLGAISIFNKRNNIFITLIFLLLLIQFTFFAYKLFFLSPNEYSRFWSYTAKEASELAYKEKNKFDYVILSDAIDNMEFAYPVYAKVDPEIVINQNMTKTKLNNRDFKKFDNVYIGHLNEGEVDGFMQGIERSTLFIGTNELQSLIIKIKLPELLPI